ncbi:hypothetical protein Sme01_17600 [Sphaerisporangium melleum]|uniref:DUF4439 domain-containing protein n=1 Tax=Sphaerisporangium melleum TaxID=321316 RepID=A0A917R1E4_9ACTN|nr:hypothetical protein [Sphaerisporangium melleum]GGK83506.1 hypothetical protein GCM10007964_27540 [Sphaerisporangium melleum]GII69284.1 hypothetical protein Sme01_17600 [Sphaerisporangium melleum]
MRQCALTRRAVLRGTAAAALAVPATGCSGHDRPAPAAPARPPDPETVLLTRVIADKERMVALYRQAALANAKIAATLRPFQQRHEAHLAELRRRLPSPATPAATPATSATPGSSPPGAKVTIGRLRDMERAAAAARPRQIGTVSPPLAQLLASIGACEAAHAAALAGSP